MTSITAQKLIELFQLEAHPEGGYFSQTYASDKKIGDRHLATAIYFLLPAGSKSHLHRLKSDEIWHFYLGGPLSVGEILENGLTKQTIIGNDLNSGHKLQYTVPANRWFGSEPLPGVEFSFVGCTVSPGFDYQDFELGTREKLLAEFPKAKDLILQLTK